MPSVSVSIVFASNGDFGSAPLAAVDVTTGQMVWRDRAVGRATLVGAGAYLILLDEDGNLALGTPGDTGLTRPREGPDLRQPLVDGPHPQWDDPVRPQPEGIVALDLR